jgi:fructose-1,6-bisphosphatase/inositol monophosphatase family enzyme
MSASSFRLSLVAPSGFRTKISGRDIVSDTGLAVEHLLVESITAGRPDDALLTEGDRRPRREWAGSPVA